MEYLEWSDVHRVGLEKFANHHTPLVYHLNLLHSTMRSGKSQDSLNRILGEFLVTIKSHFASEEEAMQTHAFPGYSEHRKRHVDLLDEVTALEIEAQEGQAHIDMKLLNFLRQWLIDHIRGMDREYAPFFQDQGMD